MFKMDNVRRNTLLNIIKLGRPQFLVGGFLLFCNGVLLSLLFNAEFILSKFILGYLILFLAHLSVHYSNDYFDFEADAFGDPTAISGGSGILVRNHELRPFSKWFSLLLMMMSLIFAAAFTVVFSYTIWFFLFVLFGNLLAWFYSAPPVKLVYRRLGEISTALTGFILPGMGYFTFKGTLDLPFLIFALPLVFLQLFFIISVEMPDIESDRLGGKRTLVVSMGREFGFKLILISAILVTLSFLLISFTGLYPSTMDFRVLTLISLIPMALGVVEVVKKPLDMKSATKFSSLNVASLFLVAILMDIYFYLLI